MSVYNPEDYKDMVLKVNYKDWGQGTECYMSNKGNIVTKYTGKLLFTRNIIERNPDLMWLFFANRLLTILSMAEVKLIRDLLKTYTYSPTDEIYIKKVYAPDGSNIRYLTIKSCTGLLLMQLNINRSAGLLFKNFSDDKYRFTVKEFENATIGL